MRIGDCALQFFNGQCFRVLVNVVVAGTPQRLHSRGVDALKQQKLDFAFLQRLLRHG